MGSSAFQLDPDALSKLVPGLLPTLRALPPASQAMLDHVNANPAVTPDSVAAAHAAAVAAYAPPVIHAASPAPSPASEEAPAMSTLPPMAGAGLTLVPPVGPNVAPSQLLTDQARLAYLRNSGSGISQIGENVDAQGHKTDAHPGFFKTLGKVGATVGDDILRLAAPRLERLIPGTDGANQLEQQRQQNIVNSDFAQDKATNDLSQQQAQLGLTAANTAYAAARPDIEQSKIDQKQTAVQQRVGQAAAARGQKVSWDENGMPTFSDDPDSQEFKEHQSTTALHNANATEAKIVAEIKEKHYIPGTPEWNEAQAKIALARQARDQAGVALGLRAQGLQLRQNDQRANFEGIGPDGQPLANAPQYTAEDGSVTTGGLKGAALAGRQQAKAGTFNDLVGSVAHLRNAMQAYEAEGGDLSDSRLAAAAADAHSTIGKVIQGKLVTGGLSPAALTLLNAQRQTVEQAGILRSTTGGTASESGAQRILDTVPKFGSDTNQSGYSKLDQQEEVLRRLKPSVVTIAGGTRVHAGNSAPPPQSAIPPEAAAQLQDGVIHTFGNGQQWTKHNGQPVRVK